MPASLQNTTTTDDYRDTHMGGADLIYARGMLLIANNPVSLRITSSVETGQQRVTEYPFVSPTVLPLLSGTPTPQNPKPERISLVEIKSAKAGVPAQVSGWLIEPGLAGPDLGSPFTSQVSSGGSVTPGQGSVQIQKDGVLIGTEPILDFLTANGVGWVAADDVPSTRVTIAALISALGLGSTTGRTATGTASTSPVMMGFGGACQVTPVRTGRIVLAATGSIFSSAGTPRYTVDLRFGTGAAPGNGAAATGTQVTSDFLGICANAPTRSTWAAVGVASGLTVGTTYWADLGLGAPDASTVTVERVDLLAIEL